jgi:hypothetical protein
MEVLKNQLMPKFVSADDGLVDPSKYPNIRNPDSGLVFPSSAVNFTVTLKATLDNGLTVTIPSHELLRPVRGLDQAGKPQLATEWTEVAIYEDSAPDDAIVLGRAFLSTVMLSYHHEYLLFRR